MNQHSGNKRRRGKNNYARESGRSVDLRWSDATLSIQTGVLENEEHQETEARHTHGKIHLIELNLRRALGDVGGNLNCNKCVGNLDVLEKEIRLERDIA